MNRNMSRSRNREQRTRPVREDNKINITLHLSKEEHERMQEIERECKYAREDIFRVGLDHLST